MKTVMLAAAAAAGALNFAVAAGPFGTAALALGTLTAAAVAYNYTIDESVDKTGAFTAALEDFEQVADRLEGIEAKLARALELEDVEGQAEALAARVRVLIGLSEELRREVAAATAQARLSAIVVGGAPALLTLGLMVRGTLATLLSTGAGITVLCTGLALQLLGMALVAALSRRAAP